VKLFNRAWVLLGDCHAQLRGEKSASLSRSQLATSSADAATQQDVNPTAVCQPPYRRDASEMHNEFPPASDFRPDAHHADPALSRWPQVRSRDDPRHGRRVRNGLVALRLIGRGNLANEALAQKIIALAKAGERDPERLCEGALHEFGSPPHA
jgi:hypothetical protein